ncbi:hypothetical protein AB1Y20_019432, partial [Prymnesium parvum]
KAFEVAQQSAEEEDSEVLLHVLTTDEEGKEAVLGTAACSLEKIVKQNKDHDGVVDVFSPKGVLIGTLMCGVAALSAFGKKDAEEGGESQAEPAKRRGVLGRSAPKDAGSDDPRVTVKLSKLTLNGEGQRLLGAAKSKSVEVEVDMLGSEKVPSRTAAAKVGRGGVVSLSFEKRYEAGPQSKLGKAFEVAQQSAEEEDSEVLLHVLTTDEEGKEAVLGTAACSLEKIVKQNKDHDGVVDVFSPKGVLIGTLMCGVAALSAFGKKDAEEGEKASPEPAKRRGVLGRSAPKDAGSDDPRVTVKLSKLTLNGEGQRLLGAAKSKSVEVEVDMLGSEKVPSRTAAAKVGRGGVVSLSFEKRYEAGPESKLGKAFEVAQQSAEEEDSEVLLHVLTTDEEGKEAVLGTAACSLEKIVKQNKDHDGVVDVFSPKGVLIGTLMCGVAALAAFGKKDAEEGEKASPEPAKRRGVLGRSAPKDAGSDDPRVTVKLSKLTLNGEGQRLLGAAKSKSVEVEVDMLGSEKVPSRTAAAKVGRGGVVSLSFEKRYEAGPESKLGKAFEVAQQSAEEEDSEVLLHVLTTDEEGKEAMLGTAACSLEKIVKQNKDHDGVVDVFSPKGVLVGTLMCGVAALSAFGKKDAEEGGENQGEPAKRRTLFGRSAPKESGSDDPRVTVKLSKLTLNGEGQRLLGAAKSKSVEVEVDMLGSEKVPSRTAAAKVGRGGMVSLSFEKRYEAGPESKLGKAFEVAQQSAEEEDSEVLLHVLTTDEEGEEAVLGTAACSLEKIVKHNKDHDGVVDVFSPKGVLIGTLMCGVAALSAFGKKDAEEGGESQAEPAKRRGVLGRSAPKDAGSDDPRVTVKLSKLTLNGEGQRLLGAAKSKSVEVEVDMLGSEKVPSRTAAAKVGRGGVVSLSFEKRYEAGPESKLGKAFEVAQQSAEEEDSEVLLHVLTTDEEGKEAMLGTAACSLEKIVKQNKDHDGVVDVFSPKGVLVGTLMCGVAALSAFGKKDAEEGGESQAEPAKRRGVLGRSAPKDAGSDDPRVTVKLSKLTLNGEGQRLLGAAKSKSVEVEVDMLGSEKVPSRTAAAKVGRGGVVSLSFEKRYEAGPESKLGKAFEVAQQSAEEEDSEVLLHVLTTDEEGEEAVLGTAACSLEKIVKQNKDHDGVVDVFSPKGVLIGTLMCGVAALSAFGKKDAEEGGEIQGEPAKRRTLFGRSAPKESGSDDPRVTVKLSKLTLNGEGQRLLGAAKSKSVEVEVDMLGSEKVPSRTAAAKVGRGGVVSLSFEKRYEAGPESKLGKAFEAARTSGNATDADVLFVVLVVDVDVSESQLAVSSCNLERLVSTGKDHVGVLPLLSGTGVILGELDCIISSVMSLSRLDFVDPAFEHIGSSHKIVIDVRTLTLRKSKLGKRSYLFVELHFPYGSALASSNRSQLSTSNAIEFDFQQNFEPTPGSVLARALVRGLCSGEEDSAMVRLVVLSCDEKGGNPQELGETRTSLKAVLVNGNDKGTHEPSPIRDSQGVEIGDLVYGLTAFKAMHDLNMQIAKAVGTPPISVHGQLQDGSPGELEFHEIKLKKTDQSPLLITVDFFGDVFISDSVELRAGKAELTFGHTFTAAIGGRARARAIAALLNSNPDGVTPHINISVLHDAEHRALVGKAKIDLLSILKSGKELKEMVLLLEHETGGEIGDLVCSLESLRTLRVLSEEANAAGRIVVNVQKVEITSPSARGKLRTGNGFVVLIDMLEVKEDKSPHCHFDANFEGSVLLKRAYSVDSGSNLRKAILKSLKSTNEEDSEIQLVVFSVGKSNDETEIGVARISLEKLLASGVDHAAGPVVLNDNTGNVIGKVTCEVSALAAMRNISSEFKGWLAPHKDSKVSQQSVVVSSITDGSPTQALKEGQPTNDNAEQKQPVDEGPAVPWLVAHEDDKIFIQLRELSMTKAGQSAIAAQASAKKLKIDEVMLEIEMLEMAPKGKPWLTDPLAMKASGAVER